MEMRIEVVKAGLVLLGRLYRAVPTNTIMNPDFPVPHSTFPQHSTSKMGPFTEHWMLVTAPAAGYPALWDPSRAFD